MFYKFLNLIKTVYQKYFEIACFFASIFIILLALLMDYILGLYACPLCILTRYVFLAIALFSVLKFFLKFTRLPLWGIMTSSFIGCLITLRHIYIQNLSVEGVSNLSGCGMPLSTTIEYYGLLNGLVMVLKGGPSCSEENWRLVFNFAEWGLIFFIIFFSLSFIKITNK
jgi:disulfide bond formation protein DsbB